jgi:hypothetical protein
MATKQITVQSSRPSSFFERTSLSAALTENFASAAMVRVLLRGMAARGLRLPVIAENLTQATVSLDLKRAVVHAAVEQAGLAMATKLALTAGCLLNVKSCCQTLKQVVACWSVVLLKQFPRSWLFLSVMGLKMPQSWVTLADYKMHI